MKGSNEGWISLKHLEVTQPIGTFYVCVLKSDELERLSYSDVRRIRGEKREVETYLGIERPLSDRRVRELKQYVRTVDATFPTSIILAVGREDVDYDDETGELLLKDREDVAKVLDGQHRIAGLEQYPGDDFELIVTIFVDMDIEDQAMVFATINLEQTKVNKSLVYDLYDYMRARSPQKTGHMIVRLLDSRQDSPFEGKIKMLGTARDPQETLSQAVFVEALLPLITRNAVEDRDKLKRGQRLERASKELERSLIFRNMFLDQKDADIARVLWNYFGAVEDKWGNYWRKPERGNLLNRTTGFRGLMLFLPYAYLYLGQPGSVPSREDFGRILARIALSGADITRENFPPGTGGQILLRDTLLRESGIG